MKHIINTALLIVVCITGMSVFLSYSDISVGAAPSKTATSTAEYLKILGELQTDTKLNDTIQSLVDNLKSVEESSKLSTGKYMTETLSSGTAGAYDYTYEMHSMKRAEKEAFMVFLTLNYKGYTYKRTFIGGEPLFKENTWY